MEAIMSWAKENFDLICLLIGVLGVLVSVICVFHEITEKKNRQK